MKALRTYLTINAVVALLSGLAFLLVPQQLTTSQGATVTPGLLIFARTIGGMILAVAILDWYARDLKDRRMMQGVLLTNLAVHAFSVAVDAIGVLSGAISGGSEWYNIGFRSLFALGFLYFLIRNPLQDTTR